MNNLNNGVSSFAGQNFTSTQGIMWLPTKHLLNWFMVMTHCPSFLTWEALIVAKLEEQLETHDTMLRILKGNLLKAPHQMKLHADQHHRDLEFAPRDTVWLKIQLYRRRSLARSRFEKLSQQFFGAFKVVREIGKVAYELELPSKAKIHPVFRVSLLCPAHGQHAATPPPPFRFLLIWSYSSHVQRCCNIAGLLVKDWNYSLGGRIAC